jgi:hypothetical protein
MKLAFYWSGARPGTLEPSCDCDLVNEGGVSLLAALLVDDGGCGHLSMLPWIYEGIARVDAVMSGQVESSDWDRETFGAHLTAKEARLYFLLDESYAQVVPIGALRESLWAWAEFIRTKPDPDVRREIEL